ncbi:endomembrane protein 70 subfamily protein [Besnoitia besnoiti]|uniref:Transmembrane 9 superfamily member n=1 Tax=Besnoitia besnoiti TaxID=94643 RepID=A0A2A9MCK6_BESBE|nr:endomembrane protein 70 subfamily protein [Besnoitia besnoiti]PFH33393.1 endomembrane protein 70 subfamily protein [Besnoitia besnoiti]
MAAGDIELPSVAPRGGARRSGGGPAKERKSSCVSSSLVPLLGVLFLFLLCYKLATSSLLSQSSSYLSAATSHRVGSPVMVCVSKAWPFYNPLETYIFYTKLGVCAPEQLEYAPMTLGQVLRGDRLVKSGYEIAYGVPQETPRKLCTVKLDRELLTKWKSFVDQNYFFEVYVDELPIHEPFGVRVRKKLADDGKAEKRRKTEFGEDEEEEGETRYYVRKNINFLLGYNEGQVVHAEYRADSLENDFLDITDLPAPNETIDADFTYTVHWKDRPDIKPHSRVSRQLSSPFAPISGEASEQRVDSAGQQKRLSVDVHWLGILNSFVFTLLIVLLLTVLLLRIVKADLHSMMFKLADEELAATGLEEETGWKLLHADVFRPPPHRMPLSAMVGCGAHLLMLVLATIVVGCFTPYLERGELLSCSLLSYLLTSFIAGFISSNTYRKLGGVKWTWSLVVTCMMFALPLFVIWCVLNTIALVYNSTVALPFGTTFLLFACWFFVTLPLTIIGGIWGRRRAARQIAGGYAFPCKTNKLAREIPRVRWFNRPLFQTIVSGVMPFSGIYIELHYLFMSVWSSNRIYTFYFFLLLAGVLLFVSAAAVSVLLTYMHLNAENHRWWWRSFLSGGSVSLYFFLHCVYYFFTSTRMHGLLQTSFFFGYSLAVSWMLFLMTGCVTFSANFIFVKYIYSRIKSD